MNLKIKTLLYILTLSIVVSCASNKTQTPTAKKAYNKEVPNWVYNIDEACNEAAELCASAEGDNVTTADVNAKSSLASIFQTQIKSNFTLEKYGYTGPEAEALQESVNSSVSETVDTILKGAVIKERFSKDDLHFSLAVLDKRIAKRSLREEIRSLDDKLSFHFKKGLKSSIIKMHMLLNKRSMLNEKYIIVSGSGIPGSVTYSQINSLKYKNTSGNKLQVKALNTVPRIVKKKLESMLTQMGYKIQNNGASDFLVRLKYSAKEEYLNVKGFKKFSFSLNVDAKNNSGTKVGSTVANEVSLGRNKQDAFLKVKEKLVEQIRSNIDQLNIK